MAAISYSIMLKILNAKLQHILIQDVGNIVMLFFNKGIRCSKALRTVYWFLDTHGTKADEITILDSL